jgi:hypothetical protein
LADLTEQVPADFQFGLKDTDEITIKKFPNLPRFGHRTGKPDEHFLNATLFTNAFLRPCETICQHVGLLMFEFSRFYDRVKESYPEARACGKALITKGKSGRKDSKTFSRV